MTLLNKSRTDNTIKVKDVFRCFNGGTFKSSDYVEKSKEKLITIKNIDENGFNTNDVTYFQINNQYQKYKLSVGDILLTMTGAYLGRCGIVDEDDCYQNQRILKIECVSKAFCYAFLKTNETTIFQLGRGSAQPNLSLEDFYKMDLNYSVSAIKDFKKYDILFFKLLSLKRNNKKLRTIKQQLLQKCF